MEYVPGKIDDEDMLFFFFWLAITPLVFFFAYLMFLLVSGKYSPHHAAIATWNELCNAWDDVDGDFYFTDEGVELL